MEDFIQWIAIFVLLLVILVRGRVSVDFEHPDDKPVTMGQLEKVLLHLGLHYLKYTDKMIGTISEEFLPQDRDKRVDLLADKLDLEYVAPHQAKATYRKRKK